DETGILYGSTAYGGASNKGTVFELSPAGVETVLYSFSGGGDGSIPMAGLARAASGALYGTTYYGGAFNVGVVFELGTDGAEIVVHSFSGADGAYPEASLISDAGTLYGTTTSGGSGNCPGGCGTVFTLNSAGGHSVLYSFAGPPDGSSPIGG